MTRPFRLGVVAGELSGDALGGALVQELRKALPATETLELSGIGGPALCAAGLESMVPLEELSMHGFAEPIRRLPFLWDTLKRVEQRLCDARVDAFVGVDFNVFNLLLEARLKRRGIPVVHYVSPSVYAWRRGRTRRVARSCDILLTLFPFEPPLYDSEPVRAVFVGHPLADEITPASDSPADDAQAGNKTRQAARELLNFAPEDLVVTLMPGSRLSEVRQMLVPFLQTAVLLCEQRATARFVVPCATPAIADMVRAQLRQGPFAQLPISLETPARQALAVSDVALIKSGTSTLEAMLLGVPMVVAYRLPGATYQLVRRLLRTEFVALPNILAGEALVPELLQGDMHPAALAQALAAQLDSRKQLELRERFAAIHTQLRQGASHNAAREVLALARARSRSATPATGFDVEEL